MNNSTIDNDVQIMSAFDLPANYDYKNKLLSVVAVKSPLIKGHSVKHRLNNSNGAIVPNAEFVEDAQGGLLASLKTLTGTIEVKFECTPAYWEEFKKSSLWRYHDDIILLKFDSEGKVCGHVLKENEFISPDDGERVDSRNLYVNSQNTKAEKDIQDFAGPTLIMEKDASNHFSPKYISKDYDTSTVEKIAEDMNKVFESNGGSLDKMDIVAENYIISDVRNGERYYYILPLSK
jgi:hypothetical protein